MITRPLDLASRLQRPPPSFDWLFFVNGGVLVLFFLLFGSRFVLAPGLGVDFRMPVVPGALAGASTTTHMISVKNGGLIFADSGALSLAQLREWLKAAARTTKDPILLVRASAGVPMSDLTDIYTVAQEAGFIRVVWGAEAVPPPTGGGSGIKP
ncbi:MAG: biopolymer transporter ExbD [Opitutae bacterium]|nr:biopolymer transporter ExbD [Opitutae bacterium]